MLDQNKQINSGRTNLHFSIYFSAERLSRNLVAAQILDKVVPQKPCQELRSPTKRKNENVPPAPTPPKSPFKSSAHNDNLSRSGGMDPVRWDDLDCSCDCFFLRDEGRKVEILDSRLIQFHLLWTFKS